MSWVVYKEQKDLVRRTRCAIGILWHPRQEEVDMLEDFLVVRTSKVLVIMVTGFLMLMEIRIIREI